MTDYKAPWSTSLKWMSWTTTIVLCTGAISFAVMKLYFVAPLFLIVLIAAAPFTIRGYTINSDSLVAHRLFWDTGLPLAGLQVAEFNPNAMKKSWRTAGNGGLFSFTGYFSNKTLGDYRALVTDPAHSVILRFSTETIVVSPDSPETFVQTILNRTQASNP
jgi:hypothetical protein